MAEPTPADSGPSASRVGLSGWLAGGSVALASVVLFSPLLGNRLYGAGDAQWYVQMLGDFLQQVHHGVFPVGAGQTDLAFNGAVFPLRAAPFYQYFGALVDLLTGRSLSPVAVHNLVLFSIGVLGGLSAYFACSCVSPGKPWRNAGFAWLYLSCPGVLALVFSQDLLMSWTAVPVAPWLWVGCLLALREGSLRAYAIAGLGIAGLWYCHAPIATISTMAALPLLVIALIRHGLSALATKASVPWLCVGALCIGFPFVSLIAVRSGDAAGLIPYSVDRTKLLEAVHGSFPGSLLPLSATGMELSDLQLGYSLLAVLLACILLGIRERRAEAWAPAGVVLGGLLFLYPIPGLTDALWRSFPESVVTLAYYWPMHRIYLPLAGLLAISAAALGLPEGKGKGTWVSALLAAAVLWSGAQASVFWKLTPSRTATLENTALNWRPENRMLMVHSYGMFAGPAPTFSYGVMDPWQEVRVVRPDGQVLLDNASAALAGKIPVVSGAFTPVVTSPGVWTFPQAFPCVPGTRLLVEFTFPEAPPEGILQILGDGFFRQYILPESGFPRAFGSKPGNGHLLSLWTTQAAPVSLTMRFIPRDSTLTPRSLGSFKAYRVAMSDFPLQVASLMPLKVSVKSPVAGILETPRMLMQGYQGLVNHAPVTPVRLPGGLLGVPIPAGSSEVDLSYRLPWSVTAAFWAGGIGWIAAALLLPSTWRRPRRLPPTPSSAR